LLFCRTRYRNGDKMNSLLLARVKKFAGANGTDSPHKAKQWVKAIPHVDRAQKNSKLAIETRVVLVR